MGKDNIIYFDNAATTSPLPEVISSFVSLSNDNFANSSSVHRLGADNHRLLEKSRDEILSALGCKDHEIIFTSGATEANNLALKGVMERYKGRGNHLIISSIEHPSISNTAKHLESLGYSVSYLKCGNDGKIDISNLKEIVTNKTILISLMAVNNETGIVQNIKDVIEFKKNYPNLILHVDAVQGVGKVKIPFNDIDLITISLHKIGGLKSSGILVKRKKVDIVPILDGGGQENGYRSGTNDLAMAVCGSIAIKNALKNIEEKQKYIKEITLPIYDYIESNLDLVLNSSKENPYIINFSCLQKKASVITEALSNEGIMVSSHSACSSRLDIGSPTLVAMGKNEQIAKNAIRLSFGTNNTIEETKKFVEIFDRIYKEIR